MQDNRLRITTKKKRQETNAVPTPGISPTDIATHNGRSALELLRRHGPQTRLELGSGLGLTEPAIAGIMTRLMDGGLVHQRKRISTGRYVSKEYVLVPESAFAIGLHQTGSGGRAILLDLSMSVVDSRDVASTDEAEEAIRAFLSRDTVAARCRGIGLSVRDGLNLPDHVGWPQLKTIDELEAAMIAERVIGVGDRPGGFVVLLINETVRAGLLIGGRTFRGEHGRAGEIGAMATGPERMRLEDVLNVDAFHHSVESGNGTRQERERRWAEFAAAHLKDAVIAISGFLSPGLILVAGDLPQTALEHLVETVNVKTRSFIASFTVPDVAVASLPGGGMAEGAAVSVFVGDLFPEPSQMPMNADALEVA